MESIVVSCFCFHRFFLPAQAAQLNPGSSDYYFIFIFVADVCALPRGLLSRQGRRSGGTVAQYPHLSLLARPVLRCPLYVEGRTASAMSPAFHFVAIRVTVSRLHDLLSTTYAVQSPGHDIVVPDLAQCRFCPRSWTHVGSHSPLAHSLHQTGVQAAALNCRYAVPAMTTSKGGGGVFRI